MRTAGRITLACLAILAWTGAARAGGVVVHDVLDHHWIAAFGFALLALAAGSIGFWITEFLVGLLINQRRIVVASSVPFMRAAVPLDPSTIETANDVLTEADLTRAHNDQA